VHGAAAVAGPLIATALVGGAGVDLVWRTSALAVALTLVARGLLLAVGLGRAEWRREPPPLGAYRRVAARFALAFLLVVAATS
jgi:predicted GNAT superfamily acetyltransferase